MKMQYLAEEIKIECCLLNVDILYTLQLLLSLNMFKVILSVNYVMKHEKVI